MLPRFSLIHSNQYSVKSVFFYPSPSRHAQATRLLDGQNNAKKIKEKRKTIKEKNTGRRLYAVKIWRHYMSQASFFYSKNCSAPWHIRHKPSSFVIMLKHCSNHQLQLRTCGNQSLARLVALIFCKVLDKSSC